MILENKIVLVIDYFLLIDSQNELEHFQPKILPSILNSTRRLLITKQRNEYEFYLFIKQRFHAILQSLKDKSLHFVPHHKLPSIHFEKTKNVPDSQRILEKYGYVDMGCVDCIREMKHL